GGCLRSFPDQGDGYVAVERAMLAVEHVVQRTQAVCRRPADTGHEGPVDLVVERGDVVDAAAMGNPRLSVWVWIGAACYAAYRHRTMRFTIVPTDKGNLCVIDNADGPPILEEIESRRVQQLRREYDFMPEGDSPEQLRGRFKWLHREGVPSDEEFGQRMATVDS